MSRETEIDTPDGKSSIQHVGLRHLQLADYHHLRNSMIQSYPNWENVQWESRHIEKLLTLFPEGQICVTVNDEVVGVALSIIVHYNDFSEKHTYNEITANSTFESHTPEGDVLYGIDVFVHPDFRGLRLGRRLYEARKELCENLNLKAILAGGRIPEYKKHASELSPKQYIEKVKTREIFDPVLSFQLQNDFHVKKILKNYLPDDKDSLEYATLIEWNNIYYESKSPILQAPKSVVRLGIVQWQMRQMSTVDNLFEQVEFFVDSVSGYSSDFILFPEFFNAPLMAKYNDIQQSEAIRKLAAYTDEILNRMREMAVSYNVNIITGSMPFLEGNRLLNVGYLCRRDGTWDRYEKIHITPDEALAWGMSGGDKIEAFDTDCGKIGIVICYDVEFPEVGRILADQGIKILFVPFLTDTQNGYMRVRLCSQARAVENECYVAIAGSVGNLPKVHNMDIQYAQSGVFTPSDFSFPNNGVKAETTPNTEMSLIADVDLDLLKELSAHGSVRNMQDRRKDLYQLKMVKTK